MQQSLIEDDNIIVFNKSSIFLQHTINADASLNKNCFLNGCNKTEFWDRSC